ncbi:Crp/Fnr family transcriptional regulator [Streptacidiphilus sp. EB129]|uniref:Crp/Fnr family transcriptional regulator n=1 Tax=Streptacidiphilus sp. EB129 TaxID=3156262 RepID=UPI0035194546
MKSDDGTPQHHGSSQPWGAHRWNHQQWPRATLLGGLGDSGRRTLLSLGTLVQYADAGEVLVREGEQAAVVYLLIDGVVKATGLTESGREALLAIRMGGDLVGELAAIDGGTRSATVTTCGAVVARSIRIADFLDCLRRGPDIAHAVNRAVVGKLRHANTRRVDFYGYDVATRVARVLFHVAATYGDRDGNRALIRWSLTQPELASLAGAAEPSVQKVLRQLRSLDVVSTGYRSLTVLDLDHLEAIAFSQER